MTVFHQNSPVTSGSESLKFMDARHTGDTVERPVYAHMKRSVNKSIAGNNTGFGGRLWLIGREVTANDSLGQFQPGCFSARPLDLSRVCTVCNMRNKIKGLSPVAGGTVT
ncbi:hypothetical protein BaRGS_00000633 [Batillaria attramentaria]|uniref:Uncharacterized protein n=1 Tax=Batillaria attramentaria TaxID=370345 RepID=A0ABD0M999_9CAEN